MNELDYNYMKLVVRNGYNKNDYAKRFREKHILSETETFMINMMISLLPTNSTVVDLGCGTGVPYNQMFIDQGINILGVDLAEAHIKQARTNVAKGTYINEDMSSFVRRQKNDDVDGYMSLYSLFHLPKIEQEEFLDNVHRSLKPSSFFLATYGTELTQKLTKEFCNAAMMWEGYSVDEYKSIVKNLGFNIVRERQQSHKGDKENHYWMLLQKHARCRCG